MFSQRNGLLEWNSDFISNNPNFDIKGSIYKTLNDNVFIFTKFTIPKGCKHNIYQFIIDEFSLGNKLNGGFCYFCEFVFLEFTGGGVIESFYEKHSLCSDCVNLWKTSISMIKKIDDLFFIDDMRINRITVNIVDNRNIVTFYKTDRSFSFKFISIGII